MKVDTSLCVGSPLSAARYSAQSFAGLHVAQRVLQAPAGYRQRPSDPDSLMWPYQSFLPEMDKLQPPRYMVTSFYRQPLKSLSQMIFPPMKVVILCGGKGTRLREETEYRPKPMLPIGNRPILWHIMKTYAAYGHKDFILCLGYKGEQIKDFFRNYLWMTSDVTLQLGRNPGVQFHNGHDEEDWSVTLADTGEDTLTAGRIKRVEHYIGEDENFFLTYGDGVGDVDVNEGLDFHLKHGRLVTLTAVRPPSRFGKLELAQARQVTTFNEKQPGSEGRINGGYFVLSKKIFSYLEESDQVMFEEAPLCKIAAQGQLMALPHDGFWQPMDTLHEFTLLNQIWSRGKAPRKIW